MGRRPLKYPIFKNFGFQILTSFRSFSLFKIPNSQILGEHFFHIKHYSSWCKPFLGTIPHLDSKLNTPVLRPYLNVLNAHLLSTTFKVKEQKKFS